MRSYHFFLVTYLCFLNINNSYCQQTTGTLKYNQIMSLNGPLYAASLLHELRFNQDESNIFRLSDAKPINVKPDTAVKPFYSISKEKSTIYKNRKTKRIISRETAFRQKVIVNDTLHINWTISRKTRQIGKFKCQQAEADVFGRHYIAWFTTEIPVSDGPWKLHGLPGLILEAKEETGKIEFIFESISIPPVSPIIIEPILPLEKQKVLNTKNYVKLAKENGENFSNMMSSNPKYPGSSVKIDIKTIEIFPDEN